jgi:type VI secretion system protein ImpM
MDAGATVGFFGKLPCRGDFLRRRVRDDFIGVWDEWLQRCLSESREALGDSWLDAYLASPMWRFVLSEGVCGTGAYAGVLVPSVDRVGRYFPMTIVAQWDSSASAIDVACGAAAWFEAIETLAAEALETSDLDAFDAKVSQAVALIDVEAGEESAWLRDVLGRANFPHAVAQWHVPLASADSLQRAINALAVREIERTLRPLSLWWSDGSDAVAPSWLCARGLPEPKSFAAMLCGRWDSHDWRSVAPGGSRFVSALEEETGPVVQITASHEAVTRDWGSAQATTHFVSRPEIELWGVIASPASGAAAAQAIADGLHGIEDAASLTVIAERVRTALEAIRAELARKSGGDALAWEPGLGAIVFVARGADCALIFAGPVQAIRCRELQADCVVGIAEDWDDEALGDVDTGDEDAGGDGGGEPELIDLVAGSLAAPVEAGADVDVRYESLSATEQWLLTGAPLFSEADLNRVAAAVAGAKAGPGVDPLAKALEAMRAVCGSTAAGPLPVLLLGVAQE